MKQVTLHDPLQALHTLYESIESFTAHWDVMCACGEMIEDLSFLQATPAVLAFYRAASAEVKAHSAKQLVFANPGVVPARQLAQLVSSLQPCLVLAQICRRHRGGAPKRRANSVTTCAAARRRTWC